MTRLFALLAALTLAGCSQLPAEGTHPDAVHFDFASDVDEPAYLPSGQQAVGPINTTLIPRGPTTVNAGDTLSIVVRGAEPNQVVRLLASTVGPGTSTFCPAVLDDNCVDILNPFGVATRRANGNGVTVFSGVISTTFPVDQVWVQAVAHLDSARGYLPNKSPVGSIEVILPQDTADTDVPPVTCTTDTDWWPGADLDGNGTVDLDKRLLVDVTGPTRAYPSAPVTVDVDFAAVLAGLGINEDFDPGSMRVVRQDCGLGLPEVPSQFADRLINLDQRANHLSPPDDGRGTVVFLVDDDADFTTTEVLGARELITYGIYFDSVAPLANPRTAPTYLSDLEVIPGTTWTLQNRLTSAVFDEAAGGTMSALFHDGSPKLTSQADSCCGNSVHFWDATTATVRPFGWINPQSDFGAISLVEAGPLVSAVRAFGTRDGVLPTTGQSFGVYDYEIMYWMFAAQPELRHDIFHVAVTDITSQHEFEASYGFRPIQIRHTAEINTNPTFVNGTVSRPWASTTGPTFGVAVALNQPPTFFARIANPLGITTGTGTTIPEYMALHGNDLIDVGVPSPVTVPAGTAFFDHVGAAFLPYRGGINANLDALENVIDGVNVSAPVVETLP